MEGRGVSSWVQGEEKQTNLALDDTNLRVGFGRTPETEVINAVDDSGLAQRVWAGGL